MDFKNEWHEERFGEVVKKVGNWSKNDREYKSALYALATLEKREILYCVDSEGIDFEKLINVSAPWSSGERAMVKLAAALFNHRAYPTNLTDIFYPLDQDNFDVAAKALAIRYR